MKNTREKYSTWHSLLVLNVTRQDMAITVFPSELSAPARPPSENDRVPIWLTFSNEDTIQMYYNFLKSRTSNRVTFWSSFLFMFYVILVNGAAGYDGSTLEKQVVFVVRKARVIVCVLLWIHYYHLRKDTGIAATLKFWDLSNPHRCCYCYYF
jgi:hypothetical protein